MCKITCAIPGKRGYSVFSKYAPGDTASATESILHIGMGKRMGKRVDISKQEKSKMRRKNNEKQTG